MAQALAQRLRPHRRARSEALAGRRTAETKVKVVAVMVAAVEAAVSRFQRFIQKI